ncbi:helix-turn-helix domain-containing protein [Paraburkholderia kururiensis]|uniref:helix-turn-helix domain-containing protein n=1 Tax=Paraburkholderia kururiensis TaxID=984307 RepID=UPI0018F3E901|nr:helix-turn-helix transcriptional regulator [Paraburkholderia kururiensis]
MSTIDPNTSNFSLRLRQERRRLHMNQEDFADVGGVRKQAQSNYENGLRFPDAGYLLRIAEAGADVQYLLTGRTSTPATLVLTHEEERLLAGFRDLKVRERHGVLALIEAIGRFPQ